MIARRADTLARFLGTHVSARQILHNPLFITVFAATLLGTFSGLLLARAGSDDRVVVGNTGGTLSGVVQVNGTIIVVGGGNARTDLADLVGRSTLPWHRHIAVLIIPGWDNQQPIGALGLIERGGVAQVVILGQPADNPAWIALEQAAAHDGIPVAVASGHNRIRVTDDIQVDLLADEPNAGVTAEFTTVSLLYHQSTLTFIDASTDGINAMTARNIAIDRSHVLAEMRPLATLPSLTDVVLQTSARVGSELSAPAGAYFGEIKSGQRISIRLTERELRLPFDALNGTGPATSSKFNSTPAVAP